MVEVHDVCASDACASAPPEIPGYSLFEKIGAGGMGEVYRATQLSLNRTVAIKILDAGAHSGPGCPLEPEGRVMAALAHPHVVTIYDCGQVNDRQYLVMEFIGGSTLRSRMLPDKGLAPDKAGPIVDAIAQALVYIHSRGILHLDLKPENVLCTEDGQIKVSDFGLACWQSVGPAACHAVGGFEDTTTTRDSASYGTVDYCSPEQRHGLPLDRRSDVFALATIAYELLTGRLPGRVYLPATELNPALPTRINEVLHKGLARDPDERYRTVEEFRRNLARALGRRSGATLAGRWLLFAVLSLSLALCWTQTRLPSDPGPPAALPNPLASLWKVMPFPGQDDLLYPSSRTGNVKIFLLKPDGTIPIALTANEHRNTFPAISPDGKRIVFTCQRDGARDLLVMDADGENVKPLTTDHRANRAPSWSPDGRHIVFAGLRDDGNSDIFVIDADGAAVVNVTNDPAFDGDPAWSPDGRTIVYTSRREEYKAFRLMAIDPAGKNKRVLLMLNNHYGYVYPAWSPDGERIAYADMAGSAIEIFVCRADGTAARQLTRLGGLNGLPAWSPDGQRIAFQHSNDNDELASLYMMDRDGSNVATILKNAGPIEGGRPAWMRR